jgi:peptide deformylase
MKVLKFPDPALFKVCIPVTVFETELKLLLDNMYRTMHTANGVGLAANQVGLEFRMFVMDTEAGERINVVNPIITKKSLVTCLFKESCLSAPGEQVVTGSRHEWVEMQFQNEKGEARLRIMKGIDAICIEHEIEHLDGKSFMESKTIPKTKRKELAKKWGLKM